MRARKRSLVLFHDLVVGLWDLIGLGPRLFLPFRLGFRFDRLEQEVPISRVSDFRIGTHLSRNPGPIPLRVKPSLF